jgi:hypothetical protein
VQLSTQSVQQLLWRLLISTVLFASLRSVCHAQESAHSTGWVVIPIEAYRELRSKAFPSPLLPAPAIEATLTRVDYELRVNDESASGQAALTVDVLSDGWVRVPIPPGLLVRDAQLDGKPLALALEPRGKSGGRISALVSHSGRSVLLLNIVAPVTSEAASENISLPTTASGITRASVQLSRPDLDVSVRGGLLTQSSQENRVSKWTAYGHGTNPLSFTWRRTEAHRNTLPLRQRDSLTELVSLGEDSTSIAVEVNLEVAQGSTQEAKIHLGDGISINQVSGASVADWQLQGGELIVKFLDAIEQTTPFVVNGEVTLPRDGAIDIPVFHLLNTERETGGVAVEVLGAGEIKATKLQGLEEADSSDFGELVASRVSPSMAVYRFQNGGSAVRALSVSVARYTQKAVLMANIEEARYRALLSSDGKSLVQARYAVRNNQRNFLKVTLPAGASLWSAALAGRPVRPGRAPDGSLLLPLEKARAGDDVPEFAVELVYFEHGTNWEQKGRSPIPLPTLDLSISRTGLLVYYPPNFKVSAEAGIFRADNYAAPAAAALHPGLFAADIETAASSQKAQVAGQSSSEQDGRLPADKFFRKSQGARARGILPIRVPFPSFGPSLFLVAELTSANQVPTAWVGYEREKKGARP